MLRTLNPSEKTREIMGRYRPIAPRPTDVAVGDDPSMPPNIRHSTYLRNVWPQLQARPTRTRKRGRTSVGPPLLKRRTITYLQPLALLPPPPPPYQQQGFAHSPNGFPQHLPVPNQNLAFAALTAGLENPVTTPPTLVTLPILQSSSLLPIATQFNGVESYASQMGSSIKDLNMAVGLPEESYFLQNLQGPTTITNVIVPQLIRLVGSSITVRNIYAPDDGSTPPSVLIPKNAEEVEEEVESEALPIVVSDSKNQVRMVNSAYKEMVGQPECSWLESMVSCNGRHGGISCKRLCGEVMLRIPDSGLPVSSDGFCCLVGIEWGNDEMKSSIDVVCDATRLSCQTKDYLFAWRFRTREASESTSHV